MNLIEKWKSRETKRSLREENISLKAENERLKARAVERKVQRVAARKVVTAEMIDLGYTGNVAKYDLCKILMDQVFPFVSYTCSHGETGMDCTATLYVITRDKRWESEDRIDT